MLIYIASSFRNVHGVRMLRDLLRERGHEVPDWTELPPPLPASLLPEERRAALATDASGKTAQFCADACVNADLVIHYGPSGEDAACEIGMAFRSGAPVLGLRGPFDAPGLIVNRVVQHWFEDHYALLRHITAMEKETKP